MGGSPLDIATAMSQSIICDRAFELAFRVLKLCGRLWNRGPEARHIASQLMRCGTSIGANADEAQDGHSKADFIARLSISRKESRETLWWLRLAVKSGVVTKEEVAWELDEARQLRVMIVSAIKTGQSSPRRHS